MLICTRWFQKVIVSPSAHTTRMFLAVFECFSVFFPTGIIQSIWRDVALIRLSRFLCVIELFQNVVREEGENTFRLIDLSAQLVVTGIWRGGMSITTPFRLTWANSGNEILVVSFLNTRVESTPLDFERCGVTESATSGNARSAQLVVTVQNHPYSYKC